MKRSRVSFRSQKDNYLRGMLEDAGLTVEYRMTGERYRHPVLDVVVDVVKVLERGHVYLADKSFGSLVLSPDLIDQVNWADVTGEISEPESNISGEWECECGYRDTIECPSCGSSSVTLS